MDVHTSSAKLIFALAVSAFEGTMEAKITTTPRIRYLLATSLLQLLRIHEHRDIAAASEGIYSVHYDDKERLVCLSLSTSFSFSLLPALVASTLLSPCEGRCSPGMLLLQSMCKDLTRLFMKAAADVLAPEWRPQVGIGGWMIKLSRGVYEAL